MKLTLKEVAKQASLVAAIYQSKKVLAEIKKNPKKKVRVGDQVITFSDIQKAKVRKVKSEE